MYDVVTIGESMLRLSPPGHGRLRRMRTLDVHMCGSQQNVAANLARLGLKTAFLTKLPNNALCALHHTIPGDVAQFTVEEVEAIMDRADYRVKR